jgi:hypothetical protein|tara:strand:+ start:137 stop:427 length:291 start_codon:yes stop_codon:yes gene_type:complete
MFIEYIIYGIVDNFVLIIGALCGLEVEKILPKKLRVGLGAVVGAGLGNAVSDFLGGITTASIDLAVGTSLGCLIALVLIPIIVVIGKVRRIYKGER